MAQENSNAIQKTWDGLSLTTKIVIIVIILIIVYILVSKIKKSLAAMQVAQSTKAEINAFQNAGEKPTYAQSQYKNFADKLYTAMKGAGTYEDDVDDVFDALVNNTDFLMLKAAFGTRDEFTMQEWLTGDLDSEHVSEINSNLAAKGIIYRI